MKTYTKQKLTFEQFLEQYPDQGFYKLIDGEIVEVCPSINHDDIANYALFSFNLELTAEQILAA